MTMVQRRIRKSGNRFSERRPDRKIERPGRGASRPGRWRSLGGLESVGYSCSKRSFPRDFAECFNCFLADKILAGIRSRMPCQMIEFAIFSEPQGSGGEAVHAGAPQQVGELLAGIEHARLYRRLR